MNTVPFLLSWQTTLFGEVVQDEVTVPEIVMHAVSLLLVEQDWFEVELRIMGEFEIGEETALLFEEIIFEGAIELTNRKAALTTIRVTIPARRVRPTHA
jgi:hypothetical protein